MSRKLFVFFCCFLLLVPAVLVRGDNACCEPKETGDKKEALKYKIAGIATILVAGAIGVCLPVLGKAVPALSPESNIFVVVKAFAAGVILSTGFVHVLPDAFENLSSPCLSETPWEFPFAGFVAMLSAIGTLMIDTYASIYYRKSYLKKSAHTSDVQVHTHMTHGHSHGSVALADDSGSSQLLRDRVISQVLEMGIVVHSVIIGISMGASESVKTVRPLLGALTFHQFFEGMGLGGCITQAKFKCRAVTIMALFFSLTTPVGIAIGIGISSRYDENSPTALIVEGIFNAASAGILIYMSLVDLLAADFMNPKLQCNGKLQLAANVSLLLGAGCMAVLAKWA